MVWELQLVGVIYLVSRADLLNRSDLSHCAFVGHYDVGATAVIHQCYTTGQRRTKAG